MLGKLRGYITIEDENDAPMINVNGMFFELEMLKRDIAIINSSKEEKIYDVFVKIYPETLRIFGFINKADKGLFELFSSINGVGSKVALSVVDALDARRILMFVQEGDKNAFAYVPGIGKKLAARILVELESKKESLYSLLSIEDSEKSSVKKHNKKISNEAVEALVSIGVVRARAQKIVSQCILENEDKSLSDLIKIALSKV